MAKFITDKLDFSAITSSNYPPINSFIFGFDIVDDVFKKIDSNGVITIIGNTIDNFWSAGTGTSSTVMGGSNGIASGNNSIVEGQQTTASGNTSHAEGYGNLAFGDNSHAEGYGNIASGDTSHVEGGDSFAGGMRSHAEGWKSSSFGQASHAENSSNAYGDYSHAEGYGITSGTTSHAEGNNSLSLGSSSHAEGNLTTASGDTSHAEGSGTTANGVISHSEGFSTIANGNYSHSEGSGAIANGSAAHAEGLNTTAIANAGHTEGNTTHSGWRAFSVSSLIGGLITIGDNIDYTSSFTSGNVILDGIIYPYTAIGYSAPNFTIQLSNTNINSGSYVSDQSNLNNALATNLLGDNSHAEGSSTFSFANNSHAEGYQTVAAGNNSHAEGFDSIASGGSSHAENYSTATGTFSHSEGHNTMASGDDAHSEGTSTIASGNTSHAEGQATIALGDYSHSEGNTTTAIGNTSHAEGSQTTASGGSSHAEGGNTIASGSYSHSEGFQTTAGGNYSHAGGFNTVAIGDNSFAHGSGNTATGINTTVLGSNLIGALNNTVYVNDLVIKKFANVPNSSTDPIGEDGSVTWDNSNFYWKANGQWLSISGQTFDNTGGFAVVTTNAITSAFYPQATGGGDVTFSGASPVTAYGVVWSLSPSPTLSDSFTVDGSGVGPFVSTLTGITNYSTNYYVRAYATNSSGTAYGNEQVFQLVPCLAEGTKIKLANNTYKNIEDIVYDDELLVWDFDLGIFENSKPLWIKETQTTDRYNKLVFSDGTILKTIGQHRIFNIEKGEFTYPMTENTPIGTTTFNSNGDTIMLVHKEVVEERVNFYNIMTNKYVNLFAEDILTSSRYNNLYPIVDMKFVKDNRKFRTREEFANISDKYFYGLRLEEQTLPLEVIESSIDMLEKLSVKLELA